MHSKNTIPSEAGNLRISEIFFSLQGETSRTGLPTVFVRLTGCPLRCSYCDTAYAFHGGDNRSIAAILSEIAKHTPRYVTVTGGEPLAQAACLTLLQRLCDAGYSVSLETSNALDIADVDGRVSKIVDIKTPGSGEAEKNRWRNLNHLTPHDELKIVVCDEADYQWALALMHERHLARICPVLLSPAYGELDPGVLGRWVLRDHLQVRVQIQLHKFLWGEGPAR